MIGTKKRKTTAMNFDFRLDNDDIDGSIHSKDTDIDIDQLYGNFDSFDSSGSSQPVVSYYCIRCLKVVHEAKLAHDMTVHPIEGIFTKSIQPFLKVNSLCINTCRSYHIKII